MNQTKYWAKIQKQHDDFIRKQCAQYVGEYPTFKEARKNARMVASINGKYGYIVKSKNGFVVNEFNDVSFEYYVHRDGRVCLASEIQKEDKKWKRHPERLGAYAYPFAPPRNRKPGENKQDYIREMSVRGRCPF